MTLRRAFSRARLTVYRWWRYPLGRPGPMSRRIMRFNAWDHERIAAMRAAGIVPGEPRPCLSCRLIHPAPLTTNNPGGS
jgi:hypothetical protein